jgi:pimeloyl-ACP methyl ester carboxylesterase
LVATIFSGLGLAAGGDGSAWQAVALIRCRGTRYPLIADNFIQKPSSGPEFAQLASQFFEELARNSRRLPELGMLDMPVTVIWGEFYPYFTKDMGRDRASHFKHASLHVLPAGHGLQSDVPEQVAKVMLS